jgi:asparagine synthase (glutamine-hydrolysing)
MCGILGVLARDRSAVDPVALQAALSSLRHRGPDDEGYVLIDTASGRASPRRGPDTPDAVMQLKAPYAPLVDEQTVPCDLVLAARRLAIQDLSAAGHQPLCNEDGSVWVVHNGEIHNFVELRNELSAGGHRFRSHADTEVVVHAYEEWGEDCFHRFNGMWGLALWDARRRLLLCSRDRYGIKPLVYTQTNRGLAFASEIKALLSLDAVSPAVNELLVYDYLAHGFVDYTSETFFRDVSTLPPGHLLRAHADDGQVEVAPWYQLPVSSRGDDEWVDEFAKLFTDSTRLRLVSDVPVGTCLSGGLDSSAIVCTVADLAASGSSLGGATVQKTFSARYPQDPSVDEGTFIAAVARQSGAEPHEVVPTGESLLEDLDRVIWHQEEPFGSTSIYAQWCVYRLARAEGVTVTLDGQGGDEVVGGYTQQLSPFLTQLVRSGRLRDWSRELRASHGIEGAAAARALVATALRSALWSTPAAFQRAVQAAKAMRRYPDWLDRRAEIAPRYTAALASTRRGDKFSAQMVWDLTVGLRSLLRYCDRNSMAHSVEARLPFLDHRLVELCFSLPSEARIHDGRTKAILRAALGERLPNEVAQRRDKIGFGTPEGRWLRDELGELVDQVLSSQSFAGRGYVKPERFREMVRLNAEGDPAHASTLWRCVNLELWFRRFIDAPPELVSSERTVGAYVT